VRKARGAWRLVQITREKFEPYFELDPFFDLEWPALNLDGGNVSIVHDSIVRAEDDEALRLNFPRIHLVALGGVLLIPTLTNLLPWLPCMTFYNSNFPLVCLLLHEKLPGF